MIGKYAIGFRFDSVCVFGFLAFLKSLDKIFNYVLLVVFVLVGRAVTV